MLTGMLLGAALVIGAIVIWKIVQNANDSGRLMIGLAVVGILIAGTIIKLTVDRTGAGDNAAGEFANTAIDWQDVVRASSSLREDQPVVQQQSMQIASVPSMITGLEQKLAAQPNDASGWALLAQSYAFIGQADLAEQALGRAVSLGLDEDDLRQRIASATRSPHAASAGSDLAGR